MAILAMLFFSHPGVDTPGPPFSGYAKLLGLEEFRILLFSYSYVSSDSIIIAMPSYTPHLSSLFYSWVESSCFHLFDPGVIEEREYSSFSTSVAGTDPNSYQAIQCAAVSSRSSEAKSREAALPE